MARMIQGVLHLADRIDTAMRANASLFGTAFSPISQAELMQRIYPKEEGNTTLIDILEQLRPLERKLFVTLDDRQKPLWNAYKTAEVKWLPVFIATEGDEGDFSLQPLSAAFTDAYDALYTALGDEQKKQAQEIAACWQQEFRIPLMLSLENSFLSDPERPKKILFIPQGSPGHEDEANKLCHLFMSLGVAYPFGMVVEGKEQPFTFHVAKDGLLLIATDDHPEDPGLALSSLRSKLHEADRKLKTSRWRKVVTPEGDAYEYQASDNDDFMYDEVNHHVGPREGNPLAKYVQMGGYIGGKFVDTAAEFRRIEEAAQHDWPFEAIEEYERDAHEQKSKFLEKCRDHPRFIRVSGPLIDSFLKGELGLKTLPRRQPPTP